MDATLPLAGLLVGILVGLTGMGSGSLLTPFLILAVGTRPVVAVGTNLVYSAVTKFVGAGLHARQGTVDLRLVGRLALGSIPAGLLTVLAVQTLPGTGVDPDFLVRRCLGAVLIAVAAVMLFRMCGFGHAALPDRWRRRLQERGTVGAGAIVGALVGVTSVGSGTLLVPFLVAVFPLSPARVVGTDVFHAAVLVSVTGLAHAQGGTVDWPVAALLLAGSIPGVALGSWMAPRLPLTSLRVALVGLVLVSGMTLI